MILLTRITVQCDGAAFNGSILYNLRLESWHSSLGFALSDSKEQFPIGNTAARLTLEKHRIIRLQPLTTVTAPSFKLLEPAISSTLTGDFVKEARLSRVRWCECQQEQQGSVPGLHPPLKELINRITDQ